MKRRETLLCLGIVLACLICTGRSDEDVRIKKLDDDIVEKRFPDGRRTIVVGSTELADRTPAAEPAPKDLSPAEAEKGFVLYRRTSSDQVFRGSAPKSEERVEELTTALSLGEKRHVQFAVYALRDLGRVSVSAGRLADAQGNELPNEAITVRPVRLGLWRNFWDPYFQEAPKLIDTPESSTEVPARESRQFWVTVHAPPSAKAGNYTTTLAVRAAGGEVATLELKVQVLPFELDQGMWWGVFYYPGFNASTPRDFADMKAHGVNSMLICPPGNREPVLTKQGDKVVASFPLADKAMAELNRQGFERPVAFFPRMLSCRILRMFGRIDGKKFENVSYYGQSAVKFQAKDFPDDLKPVLKDLYRQMVDHAKQAGWPEIVWFLVDEPGAAKGHEVEMEWAKLEYALFREACPDQRTLCTAYSQDVVDQIGHVDVRICDLWRTSPQYIANAQKQKAQVWPIRWLCQHNTYEFPRQFAGLSLHKWGVQGFAEWTYYGAPEYDPYNQLRNQQGCHYSYLNENGQLLSTLTWEAVQEGIDDGRYVSTLRKLIDKSAASKQESHKALGAEAHVVLRAVLGDVPEGSSSTSEAKLDELRETLATEIVKLIGAGVTINP